MIEISRKIINLIENARQSVAKNINSSMVITYYAIGKLIVEEFQSGEQRAAYGKHLLRKISVDLTQRFNKGFSVQNLERMRNFYLVYSKSSTELRNSDVFEKSSNVLRISGDTVKLLPISWSHYLFLLRIENSLERQFYEIESFRNQWNLEELERQYNSGLFERLILGKDKESILALAQKGQVVEKPDDLYKNPFVLEFLGLDESITYSETELETAIINKIEHFMLEQGNGFFFGGRQVRFTFDEDHFFVDLVFYNRLLHCFVLIDLKIGKLKHQDLGQMQMYVNYYDRYVKLQEENPTIGIILCKDKHDALVEISLPEAQNQLFAAKYQTVLPSKDDLKLILNSYNI